MWSRFKDFLKSNLDKSQEEDQTVDATEMLNTDQVIPQLSSQTEEFRVFFDIAVRSNSKSDKRLGRIIFQVLVFQSSVSIDS